jgi:hypothetical protein
MQMTAPPPAASPHVAGHVVLPEAGPAKKRSELQAMPQAVKTQNAARVPQPPEQRRKNQPRGLKRRAVQRKKLPSADTPARRMPLF